jgi:integrase
MTQSRKPSRKPRASVRTGSEKPADLGPCVVARPRADGTWRVLFEVPARNRPPGWPSTRPLPTVGRRGDLTDPAEVARIRADAERLHAELQVARMGGEARVDPDARCLETLIDDWKRSQEWKDNKPRTNKGYNESLKEIRAWAEVDTPDPAKITSIDVEMFLAIYDDRPTTRYHVRKALRLVMKQAVRRKWRLDNPVDEVKVPMPKSRVRIWEQDDVDLYVWAAIAAGNPDLAAIILTEWEIGQRLTDVVLFRRGAEFLPAEGVFSFSQSKTAENVAIPVSGRLRGVLAHIKRDGSPYLFHDGATKRPYRDVDRLSHVFADVRDRFIMGPDDVLPKVKGGRRLVLRAIRHSCVVQLARAGCEIPEIASITGHSPASAAEILRTYLPRDSTVAANAQRKRGLI